MDNNKLNENLPEGHYIKQMEDKIKKLDEKIHRLLLNIREEKEIHEAYTKEISKHNFENALLKDKYENIKRFIRTNGIFLFIENKGYKLHEWESLKLRNRDGIIEIINHETSVIHSFNEYTSHIINDILEQSVCSIVVVRIEKYKIKIQLRVDK